MAREYVVTTRGTVPPDLGERIAAAHAAAIRYLETANAAPATNLAASEVPSHPQEASRDGACPA